MQFHLRGDRMKYLFFILLLLLSSCISAVKNNEINRNVQPIHFSKVDANEDGKITEEETKAFNALEQTNTNISSNGLEYSRICAHSINSYYRR